MSHWEDRERWGIGRLPGLDEIEGLAQQFLELVHSLRDACPDVHFILAVLQFEHRVSIRYEIMVGVRGWSHRRWLFVEPGLSLVAELLVLAHEMSHWFLTDLAMPANVQEAIMPQFLLCWRMPRAQVLRVVRRNGGFLYALEVLLALYDDVASPLDIVVRAAMICDVAVFVYDVDGSLVTVGTGLQEVNVALDESEARMFARQAVKRGCWVPDPRGFIAVPLRAGERTLAIVAVDLTREGMVEAG